MQNIFLKVPSIDELNYRQEWMNDPKTMSYNAGYDLELKGYDKEKLFVFPEATSNFAYVDLSGIKFPITLRTRKEGDMISPFGMSGSMKLKKYMNAKGIQRYKRDSVPLLCDGNDVLWAAGVGISNSISVKDKPTHVIEIR